MDKVTIATLLVVFLTWPYIALLEILDDILDELLGGSRWSPRSTSTRKQRPLRRP